MRALALIATLMVTLPLGFVAPYAGVLMWCWLSFMNPQQIIFLPGLPVVYITAVLTAVGLVISREPKRLPRNAGPWVLLLFMFWTTVTTVFAFDPPTAWHEWTENIKTFVLALTIMVVMTNRTRLHALVWVYVLSIAYFSVKGGLFTLMTGGSSHVMGIGATVTGDNNNLGLIMVMSWPLLHYLRLHSANRFVKIGLLVVMAFTIVGVLGTYSRGAFLALAAVIGYFWWKAKRKLTVGILGLIVVVPAVLFMPQQWVNRIRSIDTYSQDSSAMGRINQWAFAIRIATDRPLVGGGFNAAQNGSVVSKYYPGEHALAYHSIWFEALGDHGFIGLSIFISIGLIGWRNGSAIRKVARSRPDLTWAYDLATMSQVTLTGYFIAGTFLSLAYYDGYYAIFALLAGLRNFVENPAAVPTTAAQRKVAAMPLIAPRYGPGTTQAPMS